MANTFSQVNIHIVMAVKYRMALIQPGWKDQLHKLITAMVQSRSHKLIQINSMPDHIHILIGLRPYQAISDLVQIIKTETTKWINRNAFCCAKFQWQLGFGAFSCANSDLPRIIQYIQNQEQHHRKQEFREEFKRFLTEQEVKFEETYLFEGPK